jgi:DNA-binding transcriptional LysR family regulator
VKLDVESLRALKAVVDTGTFTEAAAHLGMTQSAVSWKIKRLEERVGLELVKRGSEIEATPDGRDLLMYGERMLEAHDDAVEHLSRSDLAGVVRLGTNEDLRGGELADVLARFGRMYPQIHLDVRVQLSGAVGEWLEDGEVDLAVVQIEADNVRPDDVVLWTEPLTWVHGFEVRFDPSEVTPVVSFGPGLVYLDAAEESLRRGGLRWRTVLECPMLSGVQAAVEAGLGICALNTRNITSSMAIWDRAADHPLPHLSEVIRTLPGGDADVLAALRETLTNALVEKRT